MNHLVQSRLEDAVGRAFRDPFSLRYLTDVIMVPASALQFRTRMKSRSALTSQERILKSAVKEFARHGFAGARMDRISTQAKISKRMLFYYFGSKQRLFETVVESAWQTGETLETAPQAAAETIPFWSAFYMANADSTKIVGWEGLEWKKGTLSRQKERRAFWLRAIKLMKASRAPGGWPPHLDCDYLLFSLVAMEMAPVLLPNLASLILGHTLDRPAFQKRWIEFMQSLAETLMR